MITLRCTICKKIFDNLSESAHHVYSSDCLYPTMEVIRTEEKIILE